VVHRRLNRDRVIVDSVALGAEVPDIEDSIAERHCSMSFLVVP
jgi:hypothetical protein